MTIRRKVQLLFLFGAVLPLLVATALHTVAFYRHATQSAQEAIGASAEHAARRLDDLMLGVGRDLRSLASDDALASAPPAQLSWRLANATYAFPYLQELLWVGADGAILAASNDALVGRRLVERYGELDDDFDSVVRGAAGQLHVSDLDDVARGARGERPGRDTMQVLFLVRVDDPRGAFRGVLVGSVGASIVADILEEVGRSTPHALPVVLLSGRGEALLATAPGGRAGPARRAAGEDAGAVLREDAGARVLSATAVMGGLGTPRACDWRVLVRVRAAEVTQAVWRTLGVSTAAMLALLAVTMIAGGALSRIVSSRLQALAAASARAAHGEPGARLPASGSDELAELARAFNAALDEVAAGHRRLAAELASRERVANELAAAYRRLDAQNRANVLRSELGNLLQSCGSTEEAGAVVARTLPSLAAGASGALYLLPAAGAALVRLSSWGAAETKQALDPADCRALRCGSLHRASPGGDVPMCDHAAAAPAGAALCVPLMHRGEVLGLLHLAGVPDGTDEGIGDALAEALAAQIGLALANLRLHETVRERSIRDSLTGLYNRRHFEESLDRELARAARERRPLALLMIDVDDFNRFNDRHGHEAGDAVLRALGDAMRKNSRAGDLACRYGGDEFVVALPGATPAEAREWGARLIARLRGLAPTAGNRILPRVTLSLGLAVYPQHGADGLALLQAADLALHDAKHAGRDRLVVSGD